MKPRADTVLLVKHRSHTLVGNREICVARSLFEDICVREGELYIADNFFHLSEVNEIISALCTVDI